MKIISVQEVPMGWEVEVNFPSNFADGSALVRTYLILPSELPDPMTRTALKTIIKDRITNLKILRALLRGQTL